MPTKHFVRVAVADYTALLLLTGEDNVLYELQDTGELWRWDAINNNFILISGLGATGATGPQGATGPTGPQGATGATGGSLDYTEYVAYIIQNSNSAPSPNVAKNDLGTTVTFARGGTGDYTITATGTFATFQKVAPTFNPQSGVPIFWNIYWNNADSLGVYIWDGTGALSDDIFIGNLTIKVYN